MITIRETTIEVVRGSVLDQDVDAIVNAGFMLPAAFGFLVVAVGVVISMIHLVNQTR